MVNHARVYGFGEVVLTNDASKLSRRRSTAGSRGLHPSRNVAARDGLQAMTGLLVSWPLPWAGISSCLTSGCEMRRHRLRYSVVLDPEPSPNCQQPHPSI